MLTWVDSFLSVHGNGIDVQVQTWILQGLQTLTALHGNGILLTCCTGAGHRQLTEFSNPHTVYSLELSTADVIVSAAAVANNRLLRRRRNICRKLQHGTRRTHELRTI